MSEPGPTLYDVRAGAAWIVLNRPDSRNALSEELVASLETDLRRALDDAAVRCIVITGAGKAFCAGADLKGRRQDNASGPSPFVRVLSTIWDSPKPVIAAINGAAFAGGLGLVAACDIAIGVETAKFSFSEVRIGVIPAVISVVCVPKLGAGRAMRLFLSGAAFSASEALEYGLIHAVAPGGELDMAIAEEVAAICKAGPVALKEAKLLVRRMASTDVAAQFAWAQAKSSAMFASEEAAEGMAAFREKRDPSWVP